MDFGWNMSFKEVLGENVVVECSRPIVMREIWSRKLYAR
jgi:hypothetical protein